MYLLNHVVCRDFRWFAMSSNEGVVGSLTASACAMFQVLSARLLQLQELLAHSLFSRAWQSLAEQLAQVLIKLKIECFLN
jgi:hypothetical protein